MVLLSTTSFKRESNPSHLDEKLPSIQLENQTNPDLLPEKVEWNGTQSQRGSCLTPHNNGTTHGEWVGYICRWLHQATEWNISMHFQVWKSPCWYCSFTHICTFWRRGNTKPLILALSSSRLPLKSVSTCLYCFFSLLLHQLIFNISFSFSFWSSGVINGYKKQTDGNASQCLS